MMDGSHSVLKAQGIADEVTSRIIPQIDDNYFPFVVDYTTDRIFVFSIHNLLTLWRTDCEVDSDVDEGLTSFLLYGDWRALWWNICVGAKDGLDNN